MGYSDENKRGMDMKNKLGRILAIALVVILSISSLNIVVAQVNDDITGGFFEREFRIAVSNCWIEEYQCGIFRPNANITRAEFITLLDNVLQLPTSNDVMRFSDVSGSDWFYETLLKYQNHINVLPNNTFQASRLITREETCFIIANLISTEIAIYGVSFTDISYISSWAFFDVATLNSLGIVVGYPDGTFAPRQNITRAEAVLVVYVLNQTLASGKAVIDTCKQISTPQRLTIGDIESTTVPNVRVHTLEDAMLAIG